MVSFHLGMCIGVAVCVGALMVSRWAVLVVIVFVVVPPVVHMWRTMPKKADEMDDRWHQR